MTNINYDIQSLRSDGKSESDSTKFKHHSHIEKSTLFDVIPIKSIDSFNTSSIRSHSKSKSLSRKKAFTRYFHPTEQSHSPNEYEEEKYRHHRHYHQHHHHQQEQEQEQQHVESTDGCDMRVFIIRHGERVDRYFGSNWFMLAFDRHGQYRPYHINFPPDLPHRSNKYFWALDTPLTRDGLNAAQNVGHILGINRFEPTYVYSSPAMRCILTTYQILKGLRLENKLSIRIEPGLLELGAARFGMNIFLRPIDWYNYGIKVDLSYQPIVTDINAIEREDEYYLRSKHVIRQIEQHHHNSRSSLINILIVGHATSPDTLTWDLVGRQPSIYDLYNLSLNIGYLQMVITERKRENKFWSLTQMPLQSTTIKWV